MRQRRFFWIWVALLAALLVVPLASGTLAQDEPAGTVSVTLVNVRSGPSTRYSIISQSPQGTVFTITGVNPARDWYQVCCVANGVGWIWGQLLVVEGSTANLPVVDTPPPTSTPTPTPPATSSQWRGEYYNNRDLQGSPALVRRDNAIDFRWAGASPGPGVPGANFSVRWTRTLDFAAGDYIFFAQVDDGVRLYLDGLLLIDQWREAAITTYSARFDQLSAGPHTVTVEYFQAGGDSAAVVRWERANQFPDWKGEYYSNRNLQGSPVLVRNDRVLNFRWAGAPPGPGVAGSNFSVRWTRTLDFAAGNYTFFAQVDDGVRLYLDSLLLIDQWREGAAFTHSKTFERLGAGPHTITVEYFQAQGDSVAVVWWEEAEQFPEWKGEYFDNINLRGIPQVVRNDVQVNFNWGLGAPDPVIPTDNWSARWTRRIPFEGGDYRFNARTDDGVRLYLDGWLVIDQWRDTGNWVIFSGDFKGIGQGLHTVVVEYYARGGIAYAQVWWERTSVGGGDVP